MKWAVTVNIALAAATAAPALGGARFLLAVPGVAVAIACIVLLVHYNESITGARNTATRVVEWLKGKNIDYDSVAGESTRDDYDKGERRDFLELIIFLVILLACPILVVIALLIHFLIS